MRDPFFEKTVVLVWHFDEESALGVVVNRPLEHAVEEVLAMPDVPTEAVKGTVGWGGPVETTSGTVVSRAPVKDSHGVSVCDGVYVTQSEDALRRLLTDGSQFLLCLGYAGWAAGQLDREIQAGGWLFTDASPDLIFEGDADKLWERAIASLGVMPSMLWMQPIDE
jgi:putative transcriptional regulator